MDEIEDQGLVPEPELIEQLWPNSIQPITAAPVAERRYGRVELYSDTEGAQVGYQLLDSEEDYRTSWNVYTQPVQVPVGQRLIAIAHRIGYQPSNMVEVITEDN